VVDLPLARQLAEFATDCTARRLPAEVAQSVRMRILDILGICVAASPLDTSRSARAFVADQGGHPQSTAIGMPEAVPAALGAFVNGVLAHSLDFDDTHLPSVLHPSATVVPAGIAAAELANADGRSLTAAIAVGLEVVVRLGMAGYSEESGSSTYFDHGQHATSICGAMGGAVTAGVLLGLDVDGITNVLGVAASMSSGIIEANRQGGTVKRMHCGWAAHAAISAAQLVRNGFTGPPTVLEGRFGFFEAWLHGNFDSEAISRNLGSEWAVPGIAFKPYPANHFLHGAIDAAIALRERGLRPEDVAQVTLGVAEATVRTIGEPIEVKRTPTTGYMAQFSGPYAVAAGLFGGGGLGVGLDDFTDDLAREPARRALMAKVDVRSDARCTELFPHQFPAILTVRTHAGDTLVEEVLVNRGGPGRALSIGEVGTKFQHNAARLLPAFVVDQIQRDISRLDEIDRIGAMLEPLRTAKITGL
jgi:2-methylcitrate dehydratase PrpD